MAGPDLDKLDHRQQGNGRQGNGRQGSGRQDHGQQGNGQQGEGEPGGHGLHPAAAVAALGDVYGGVTEMLGALSEPDFLLPTRCLGWTVTDCLYHLLGDARRALTALATPATTGPDVDFVTYWKPWQPGGDGSLTRARAFRAAAATVTAVSGPAMLVEAWRETAPAAVRLAHLAPYPVVATQGHALNVADFAATLAIEATVHHLDMIAELPGLRRLAAWPWSAAPSTACSASPPLPPGTTRLSPGTTPPTRSKAPGASPSPTPNAPPWAHSPAASPSSANPPPPARSRHPRPAPATPGPLPPPPVVSGGSHTHPLLFRSSPQPPETTRGWWAAWEGRVLESPGNPPPPANP